MSQDTTAETHVGLEFGVSSAVSFFPPYGTDLQLAGLHQVEPVATGFVKEVLLSENE